MTTLTMQRTAINMEVLDEDIRQSVGAAGLGIACDGQEVKVYLAADATPAQISAVQRVLSAHDPLNLTSVQQEAADRAARLETLRAQNINPFDISTYEAVAPEIRRLAEKIAWLELEIGERR